MILTCTECGNVFESGAKQYKRLTCSEECKRARFSRITRWNAKLKILEREQDKAEQIKAKEDKPKPKKRKKISSLDDKAVEARKKGMTYGQLVALETAQTVKVERKW